MKIYTLKQILSLAKFNSPIYKYLYKDIEINENIDLKKIPILTNEHLMEIVHSASPDFVFGHEASDGIIFESSASTGKAKVTLFGRDEWEASTTLIAVNHSKNNVLRDGDRVANLCASPYISYRLVHSVIERFPGRCAEIPIGCDGDFTELNNTVDKYGANVLAGINSTMLGLAANLISQGKRNDRVDRILAGGELLYGNQRNLIATAFPKAKMISFVFGTTEAGPIAISHLDDDLNVFRPIPGASIVEIVNEETGSPVEAAGVIGKCVVTSLLRTSAPAVRIDTGDYAEWVDSAEGRARFRILGRKFPFSHTINGVSINETQLWDLIQNIDNISLVKLQLQLHEGEVHFIYTLTPGSRSQYGDAQEYLRSMVNARLPQLAAAAGIEILFIEKDFEYFMESTRRKGRLVLDCRKP
ncbi:hypothetical protein [Burkholderia glumae]|uniref:hypothetical protein n=1 Tax=Burkholderia glumae TaxID=337 RepID=UPI0012FC93F8|nr:hypothetical protein [Burkholderia glumae]